MIGESIEESIPDSRISNPASGGPNSISGKYKESKQSDAIKESIPSEEDYSEDFQSSHRDH
jgi:hypothetical protein